MTQASSKSPIVPCLVYADAPAAIEFLVKAFGFEKKMVVPGDNGTVEHAELTLGNAMVMLGSKKDTHPYGLAMKTPAEADGSTQSVYLIVGDPDAHYEQAKGAGADIVSEPESPDYGGRMYTCRDIEGHVWTVGSYDPWAPTQ